MRVGDFGVEVVPVGDGEVREAASGHVLARPGTVYALRLRNHGPLRCVATVRIDDRPVTGQGLVIGAYDSITLERPVEDGENGRFTVIAEGDERVFGPDGGRDNDALGSIEVRFRRELPRSVSRLLSFASDDPAMPRPLLPPMPGEPFDPARPPAGPALPTPPARPMAPPGWTPPTFSAMAGNSRVEEASPSRHEFDVLPPAQETPFDHVERADHIERAAGTGLTGSSSQQFVTVSIGPLEEEATVIRLRLVIGADEAFTTPRPLADTEHVPARPPARP